MKKSAAEERFLRDWTGPPPVREYRFHPYRRWRFDFAWPDQRIALEVDGAGFGHQSINRLRAKAEKYNAAAVEGWSVLTLTTRAPKEFVLETHDQLKELLRIKPHVPCVFSKED